MFHYANMAAGHMSEHTLFNSCYYSWARRQNFFSTEDISSVYNCMQTRLRGQYNGKWPISLVCVSRPLVTIITAIEEGLTPETSSLGLTVIVWPYQIVWQHIKCSCFPWFVTCNVIMVWQFSPRFTTFERWSWTTLCHLLVCGCEQKDNYRKHRQLCQYRGPLVADYRSLDSCQRSLLHLSKKIIIKRCVI